VNTREGDQICLEFVQINVQGTVKPEGCCDRRYDLSDEPVQVGETWRCNVQVLFADIVNSFVINHERTVGVLERGMCGQDRVIGLNDRVGHSWCGIHAELQFGLLAIVGRKTLQNESAETGSSSTTKGMEHEETLQTSAIIGQAADLVHDNINLLFTDGVVTTGIVARGIFFASYKGLRVEETSVCACPDLIDDIGLEINVQRPRHVFARGSLGEESAEAIIVSGWRAFLKPAIGTETVLDGVQFPTGVTDLDTSLTNVDGDDFTHFL